MQCRVDWKIITDVLKEHTATIFRVKEYSSALKIETAHSSKVLVTIYQFKWYYMLEDSNL
jgi:hypothetical protein